MKTPIAVLISGSGSNLQSLIEACSKPEFPAKIVTVISNKADAYGLERAKQAGIETGIINHKDFSSREEFDSSLHDKISKSGAEFVCLAGFMRLLTAGFVEKWTGKMINIHPSLLPSFKGMRTHEDALTARVKIHGCTVHWVVPEMDSGEIIVQAAVPVLADDTPETLGARVLKSEHKIYPIALQKALNSGFEIAGSGAELVVG